MPITTYDELKASIESWSKRDDVTDLLDTFIDLAEAEMWNDLRIKEMEGRSTASLTTRFLEFPDYFISIRRLQIVAGSIYHPLTAATPEALKISDGSGRPTSYSVTSQFEFDKTPDTSYTVELQFYKSLLPLDSTNTSNSVLTRFPQLYLYGCLWHLYSWTEELDKAGAYKDLYSALISDINAKERRGRRGPAPAMRNEGSTP